MRKKRRADNDRPQESKYEHGLYYYGDGFGFLSDEVFRRRYTSSLKQGPFLQLIGLNSIAWTKRKLVVRVAATYIAKVLPISRASAQRNFDILIAAGLVHLVREDHSLEGNWYFVEPVFLWSSKWHELEGIAQSHAIHWDWSPQNDATDQGSLDLSAPSPQNEATHDASVGLRSPQNEADPRSRSSDPDGAQRHSPQKELEGGVESPTSSGGQGQKGVLPDRITPPEEKGVGLKADTPSNAHVVAVLAHIDGLPPVTKRNCPPAVPTKNNVLANLGAKAPEFKKKYHALMEDQELGLIDRAELQKRLRQLTAEYGVRNQLKQPKKKKPAVEEECNLDA